MNKKVKTYDVEAVAKIARQDVTVHVTGVEWDTTKEPINAFISVEPDPNPPPEVLAQMAAMGVQLELDFGPAGEAPSDETK